MSTRKKTQQKQNLSHPFKFVDANLFMENAQQLINTNVSSSSTSQFLVWKNRTHIPAFGMGDMCPGRLNEFASNGRPDSRYHPPDVVSEQMPYWISTNCNTEVLKTNLDMWRNGHQFHVMQARAHGYTNSYETQREYAEVYAGVFNYFVSSYRYQNAPPIGAYYNGHQTGAAGLIRRFTYGEGVDISSIPSKIHKTGEFKTALYMAARGILMYCMKLNTSQAVRDFVAPWVSSDMEKSHVLVPLCVLVMKAKSVPLVRANWLMNEAMEADMFELWVDKSLDDEASPHPLRTQYVRSLRNPLAKLGVKVVVKDDLRTECFKSMEIPKFKTIKEEKDWVDEKVEKILDEERRRLGVQRTPPVTETAAAEFPF